MENIGLLLIFWYGILHAFGPDHLTAIADFSIGKQKKQTILITILFAFGHGFSLLLFAKILSMYDIPSEILAYGDSISALVILLMGVYLLFIVLTNKINISTHNHNKEKHVHIYFGKEHKHQNNNIASAFTIGTLMGIGGVRGMLVTLSLVKSSSIDISLVLAFTAGVVLIFLTFGLFILFINKKLLTSKKNINIIFTSVGITSVLVGLNMLT